MNPDRLESDLRGMADVGISQMIVSDPAAISYLTGTWIHPGERMPALRLSLTGRHALFVNELFSVPDGLGVETIWFNDTQPVLVTDDGCEVLNHYDKGLQIVWWRGGRPHAPAHMWAVCMRSQQMDQ
jgi:Xaa-Pro dipeptidase